MDFSVKLKGYIYDTSFIFRVFAITKLTTTFNIQYHLLPTKMSQSQPRQNFHIESEAGINRQINMELYACYVYQSMVSTRILVGLNTTETDWVLKVTRDKTEYIIRKLRNLVYMIVIEMPSHGFLREVKGIYL
jgi:hypothetical protein